VKPQEKFTNKPKPKTKTMKTAKIKISQLRADYGANVRFRDNYGDIQELADNIAAKGLLVPLSVEKLPDGNYGIISGHRRYAALQLLVEQGRLTDADDVTCVVQAYQTELERAAGKLLANDGQPLTPDEWAAEIGRLAEAIKAASPEQDFIQDIAATLGKRPEYVKTMYETWSKLSKTAREQIQTGKVGMTLAVLLAKKAASDKLASLSVEIAAAAKEQIKEKGDSVSDSVLAEAVNLTTNKIVQDAKEGKQITGAGIGADILANIVKVKGAKKAANEAKKEALSGDIKPTNLVSYVYELIGAMQPGNDREVLQQLIKCFNNATDAAEAVQMIFGSQSQTKAA
jgi:ParB/RepB/Spo0J family partition protein